ncbi:hypothetical protein HVZ46_16720 [Citrobacter freundii]|uniref:hypothetical protein n=1 Tax=Citrobacter freundii TaxID=546 RepID=UPI0015E91FC2|nr:hypothetical protein [Citrobacter freundii]QMD26100.1 hypothetical protein HVZ46_16720 [Citrobacter freundii]
MSDTNSLKNSLNTKVLKFVLLTAATGGIYPLMWLYLNQRKLTEAMKDNFVDKNYPLWIAVATGLGWFLSDFSYEISDEDTKLDYIDPLLSFVSVVMYIVWGFKAKVALQAYALNEFKFELKINTFYTFYTFLFNIYYIVYYINSMKYEHHK